MSLCASKISACKQHMNVHVIPCTSNTTAPSSFSFSSPLFVASIQALSRALGSKTGSIFHKVLRDCKYFKLSLLITCLFSFRYYPCVVVLMSIRCMLVCYFCGYLRQVNWNLFQMVAGIIIFL